MSTRKGCYTKPEDAYRRRQHVRFSLGKEFAYRCGLGSADQTWHIVAWDEPVYSRSKPDLSGEALVRMYIGGRIAMKEEFASVKVWVSLDPNANKRSEGVRLVTLTSTGFVCQESD